MTITLPMTENDNEQPPAPNPLNVLNLLLSKLKAMETSESTEEISEVDVELCNKIYYILNPAAVPPPEEPISTDNLVTTDSDTILPEGFETAPTEGAPSVKDDENASVDGVTSVTNATAIDALPTEVQSVEAPPAEVTIQTTPVEPVIVEG